jgi:signal transduction histidine kinase
MISLHDFFDLNRQLILFVYGLAFFILGFAILLQVQQSSRLELARSLRWLAAFGITHAFNEWGDLFIPIQAQYLPLPWVKILKVVQLILLSASFACLFEFGISVLSPFNLARWMEGVPAVLFLAWIFVTFFLLLPLQPDVDKWRHASNALARYFIGFPGGILAAYGLRVHAIKRIKPLNVPPIYNTVRIAGISLGLYAIFGGLITPTVDFFPGNILNVQTFENAVGIPPIIFRTIITIVVAITVIRSLEIFSVETQRRIEALEQQQILSAEHERLARELHDGAIQKVYTAGLLVESAARLTEKKTDLGSRLERAVVVLNDAIADLRQNLTELHHPDELATDETLKQMLEHLADDPHYNTLVKVSLDLTMPDGKSLAPIRERHVFAIVNEAMANIVRHANARIVSIQVQDLGEHLKVSIKDDGTGLSPNAQAGYGLRNMRDRARLLNGELRFSEPSNKGTTVTLEIPWVDSQ